MRKLLSEYSDEPIYNMKAVEQQTGISAATLRAWERRYTLVEPKRTTSGYRLYSDRDVALLRWVRHQMDEGLTVSRVVAMLDSMRGSNEPIWVNGDEDATVKREAPLPPVALVQPLVKALIDLDDDRADEIMEQAFALYTMPTVYVELITPALVEIGEAWHRGDIFISTEHFATTYLRGRLLALLQAYSHRPDMPVIFVGCAPSERHEVGALIFAVMLRQQGYNVVYLGQDVPIEDIVRSAAQEHPALVCLSANSAPTALLLRDMQNHLDQIEPPAPVFGYGGRAFDIDPDLRRLVAGHYLGSDPRDAISVVNNLLHTHRPL
ncbi:MAG: MerR family transcriptional regulator [Anaerolineae bacterium]|nr:MerR family transcriptional regulator [Anaerolineae bacterium]